MKLVVDITSPLPIYAQIMEQIRKAIAAGQLAPGEQLPTVRQLAVELRMNPNTVSRVSRELERLGLIATRQGRGTFVAAQQPRVSDKERRGELRKLVRSAVCEAAVLGFTPSDLAKAVLEMPNQGVNEDAEDV